ncbi:MAG: AAA family ATPase [Bacteroidales bacterium]|nr:AAA family ATPase [Bacteroidales bacterium]
MENLYELFYAKLDETPTSFMRYLHDHINWNNRMIAILGERGVGKTTLILQKIKQDGIEHTLYFGADNVYFAQHSLFDTANEFYRKGGQRLYIDEIHKYPSWSTELKMIYDYCPQLQVVITGSSILDLYKGIADLSRRIISYTLVGLSFREFLAMTKGIDLPPVTFEEILRHKVTFPTGERPLALFDDYLKTGYYPFWNETDYATRLNNVINQTIENDIPTYAKMNIATSRKLKQLLFIISQSVPFKPNYTEIGAAMECDRGTVADLAYYMDKARLTMSLRHQDDGMKNYGKPEKLYLGNTNLIYALSEGKPEVGNLRETFFLSQMQVNQEVFASKDADFLINGKTFEVGGKNKNKKQIAEVKDAFVVKDDIEYGYENTIPLWHFGMGY